MMKKIQAKLKLTIYVPRQMGLLYIHDVEKASTVRLENQYLVGDLVLIYGGEDVIEEEVEEDIRSNDEENTSKIEANNLYKCRKQVKCLCEEDLSEYSIYDSRWR